MWKLTVNQTTYIKDYTRDGVTVVDVKFWKEFIVPTERLLNTYNLFHGLYGKEVVKIQEV